MPSRWAQLRIHQVPLLHWRRSNGVIDAAGILVKWDLQVGAPYCVTPVGMSHKISLTVCAPDPSAVQDCKYITRHVHVTGSATLSHDGKNQYNG